MLIPALHIQPTPPALYRLAPPAPRLMTRYGGLAAACVPMSMDQIYQTARSVGFPPPEAVDMTAIAQRESAGCPTAYYGGNPPGAESSYGLVQINVKGNPSLLASMGISDPNALFDPTTNMMAAFRLWNGNDANLDTAWYVNHGGAYTAQYQANLPAAQAAAMRVEPDAFSSSTDTAGGDGTLADAFSGLNLGGDVTIAGFTMPIAGVFLGGVAVVALLYYLSD